MLRIPSNATTTRRGRVWSGASVADITGVTWYPCRLLISRTARVAAANDRTLAAASDSSYHWEARDLRWRRTAHRTRAAADQGQRHDRVEQRHPVGDDDPGEHRAGRDRDVPAPRRAVQQQEDEQQRELGAQVVGLGEQQVGGVAELGCEHDPGRDQQADQPLPPGRAPPGQQASRQHQQRISAGTPDVDHIGAQTPDQLDNRVLRDFGRVVRHVPEGPAVQQHVAVQHVPGLQGLVRAVRGSGIGPGHPQVGDKQDDGGHDKTGQPYPPGQASASELFLGHIPSGNAASHILDGTLA